MQRIFRCAVIVFIILEFFGAWDIASAHSIGQSLERTINGYRIDVGHDPQDFSAGKPIHFDFSLSHTTTALPSEVAFTNVWVRIAKGNSIFFAGWLHEPNFGLASMSYTFPEAGTYEFTVRYLKEEGSDNMPVVETTFALDVGGVADSLFQTSTFLWGLLSGLGVGFLLGVVIFSSRMKLIVADGIRRTMSKRKRAYAVLFIIAAIYLAVHFLIFDRGFTYTGFKNFLIEGKQHAWHVAPIIILFLVFVAKDLFDRYGKSEGKTRDEHTPPPISN